MELVSDFLIYLAETFPAAALILTVLSVLVAMASAVVKAFPAVDKNGKWGRLIQFLDFLSVFYPKWKNEALGQNTEEEAC